MLSVSRYLRIFCPAKLEAPLKSSTTRFLVLFAMAKSPGTYQLVPVDVELPVVGEEVPHDHDDEEQRAMSLSSITTFRPNLLAEGLEAEALPEPNAKGQGTAEEAAAKAKAKTQRYREKQNAQQRAISRESRISREAEGVA